MEWLSLVDCNGCRGVDLGGPVSQGSLHLESREVVGAPHQRRLPPYERPDDQFWAARKLMSITEEMINAAVAEGQFGDPPSEEFLARAISQRRRAFSRPSCRR